MLLATYPGAARVTPIAPLFGLAPSGVYPAVGVTTHAVRSYRTISPLPVQQAVYFLWHFPWIRIPQALPGTLTRGARTFLSAQLSKATVWPTPMITVT